MRAWVWIGITGTIAAVLAAPTGRVWGASRDTAASDEALYRERCAFCHGAAGDGKGPAGTGAMPRPQAFANARYMGRLTDQYLFEVIKHGKLAVLKQAVPGSTLEATAMPAFGDVLTDSQIRALVVLVRGFRNGAAPREATRKVFNNYCVICHGPDGRGNGKLASKRQPAPPDFVSDLQPAPPDYRDPLFMDRFSDDFLFAVIKHGRVGATEMAGFASMTPFGYGLSDEQIWRLVRYIRDTFAKGTKR